MANSTSTRELSDSLQQMWQALYDIRRNQTNNNAMECKIRKKWLYCMGWIQEKTKELWQACTSWENETVDLSRHYVCGLLPYHPGFEEPIWKETEAIRDGLVSLHDYGLITQYSEPGKFWRTKTGRENRKLPHLFFTMPTINTRIDEASIRTFLERLESTEGIWYHVTYHYASHLVPTPPNRAFLACSDRLFTNLPESDHKRFCCEQTRKKTTDWEDIGYQYFPGRETLHQGSGGLNDFKKPFQACLEVDPLQICVVSKDYTTFKDERQDLPNLVKELLVQAAFQPLLKLEFHAAYAEVPTMLEVTQNRAEDKGIDESLELLVSLVEQAEREGVLDEIDDDRGAAITDEEGFDDDVDSYMSTDESCDEVEDGDAGQSKIHNSSETINGRFAEAQAAEALLLMSKSGAVVSSASEEDRDPPG